MSISPPFGTSVYTNRRRPVKVFLPRSLWLLGALALLLLGRPTVSPAETFIAFGPVQYSRDTGKPTPVMKTFNVLDPSATFTVRIDSAGVSSAIVTLNGVDVFKESDFNQTVKVLTKAVTLLATNQLTVELRGKPGETLTLQIIGNGGITPGAPSIGGVRATPTTAVIGIPTQVSVQASITDPSLIPNSVNLLQLNTDGTSTMLGSLHDDGLNGDAFAGDLVFTLVVTLNEPSASQIQLQVSAAFKGALQTVKSPIMNVFFQAANASTVAIVGLAAELASGNISAALLRFLDSDRASAVLSNLTTAGQQRLASAFAAAQLVSSNGDQRIYQLPWIAPNGTILGLEVALQPNSDGNWVIVSW